MRLLHDKCGGELVNISEHKIVLMSYLEYDDSKDIFTLTKHLVKKSDEPRQMLLSKHVILHCNTCHDNDVLKKDWVTRCHNCGNTIKIDDVKHLGKSLILCDTCYTEQTKYLYFDIFDEAPVEVDVEVDDVMGWRIDDGILNHQNEEG